MTGKFYFPANADADHKRLVLSDSPKVTSSLLIGSLFTISLPWTFNLKCYLTCNYLDSLRSQLESAYSINNMMTEALVKWGPFEEYSDGRVLQKIRAALAKDS
jgi:hypothetical protein